MQPFIPTLVWRHRRENLKKCSLRGLESRPDFRFFSYPNEKLPDLENYIVLDLEAPPLSINDSHLGLLILDATWRYAETMMRMLDGQKFVRRSIPIQYRTAYPRRQEDCCDPARGLASIEAIYISYHILGRETKGLMDNYHWKDQFLDMNQLKS
jgi:pre-rRNA-processing protein TSR3